MAPRYKVTLTDEERSELQLMTTTGIRAAKTVMHARALLLLDAGEAGPAWKVSDVATALGVTTRTLEHLKQRFVMEGLEGALVRKESPHPRRSLKFDGDFEARLIQLACTDAPEGWDRWTIRLLADKLVELQYVDAVSHMTVYNTLKKTNFSLTEASIGKSRPTTTRPL